MQSSYTNNYEGYYNHLFRNEYETDKRMNGVIILNIAKQKLFVVYGQFQIQNETFKIRFRCIMKDGATNEIF